MDFCSNGVPSHPKSNLEGAVLAARNEFESEFRTEREASAHVASGKIRLAAMKLEPRWVPDACPNLHYS
jgi:hypothetical protein